MTPEEAQNFAVTTYNENIQYLQKNHPQLFEKISLFDAAIEIKQIQPQYDLHFIDGYFDIINLATNQLVYGKDSFELSTELVNNKVNTIPSKDSFKTFYEYNYENTDKALEKGLLWDYTTGDAPIINFVNKNLPKEESLNKIQKFIIFGVALGIHIPLIHEKIKSRIYLIVEPNLELFKLSLFVTNYAKLAQESNLILSIAEDESSFKDSLDTFYNDSFIFNHYFKFFQLSDNYSLYIKIIQNRLVSQDFYLYPYNRTFLSLYRTHTHIIDEYKTLDVSKITNLDFTKKPILFLAAGPSLQKNIDFVKENQDKFTIVAIYATMPLLEKQGIKPDIITQYDEQDYAVLNTLEKVKNIGFFQDTIFIFSSHLNAKLMNSFKKENIYIFQAMFELKEGFGSLTSSSIGELTYGLLLKLGAKDIYMLGLDLALDQETGKSHIDGHSGADAYTELKDEEDSSLENYSYKKNTIRIKGNFQESVKSTPSFKTSVDSFTFFSKNFKQNDVNVYNLSDGAYLYATTPLKIENIDTSKLEKKDSQIKNLIEKDLIKISDIGYSKDDLENINLKISNIKKVKKALDNFFKIKNYSKFKDYENNLIVTLETLLFNQNKDNNLKRILANFCQHVIPFVFHLFNVNDEKRNLSFIYEMNKVLNIQLNKLVNTYLISILYTKDESNQISKKLNKLIKEYNIEKTLYCEPNFKELAETAPLRESETSGENTLGIFAINENLENKNLIEYVSNIVQKYNSKLKVFYFFEYQKNKARQTFKSIKENLEFTIPTNLENLAKEIEVYIDLNKNQSLKDLNKTLLNKYKNILNISFEEESYKKEIKEKILLEKNIDSTISLRERIKKDEILVNSAYYSFCESLKDDIDQEKLNKSHKKEHIGFFAFDDNLTKKFIESIFEIHKNFKNIKFVAFYFEEEQKIRYQKIFKNIIENFEFITPKDIYDIAYNIEVWAQAEIRNQSFVFNKMWNILDIYSIYNYPIVFKKSKYEYSTNNYIESFYQNSLEVYLIKNLNQLVYKKEIKEPTPNTIGFLGTEENLEDIKFIDYIKELSKKFPNVKFVIYPLIDITLIKRKLVSERLELTIDSSIKSFLTNLKVFIHNNSLDSNFSIFSNELMKKRSNIYVLYYSSEFFGNKKIKDYVLEESNYYLNTLPQIGIKPSMLKQFNFNYEKILNTYLFKICNYSKETITDELRMDFLTYYIYIEMALSCNLFIEKIYQLRKIHLKF